MAWPPPQKDSAPRVSEAADVSAGGFVPLLHSSFTFAPENTTFEVPPVGFRAGGFGSVLF